MNVTPEIEILKTVVEALSKLDPAARSRIISYACEALEIKSSARPDAHTDEKTGAHGIVRKTGKPSGPQEYLRRYSVRTMTKRIGIIAVFLERERDKKRFSLKDLTTEFREAKEPKTPAHSQYARAVAMNYLAKDGEQYYATNQAEALVDGYDTSKNRDDDKSGGKADE